MSQSPIGPSSWGVGGPQDYQGLRTDVSTDKVKVSGKDSIAQITSSPADTVAAALQEGAKPQLPPAQSQNYPALEALAAAFAAIFSAMASSSMTAVEGLNQDTMLNNIQARVVMVTTQVAIEKQNTAYQHYEKLQKEANNPAIKILGWVFMAIMAVVIIATIASGFFTGGATENAVPEEIELTMTGTAAIQKSTEAIAASGAALMETNIDEAIAMNVSQVADISESAEGDVAESMAETEGEVATTLQATEGGQVGEVAQEGVDASIAGDAKAGAANLEEEVEESTAEATKDAAKKGLSRGMKILINTVASAVGSAPQLAQGVLSTTLVAQYKAQANLDRVIGDATGNQSYQEAIFKFLQQATSRDASTASQEAEGGTDVIQTYNQVLEDYRNAYAASKQSII